MLGECRRDLRQRPEHGGTAREVQRAARRGALPSAAARRRLERGPYGDYVLSVGRSNRSSAWTSSSRRCRVVPAPLRLLVAGDGTQRANVERLAEERRRRRPRDVPRAVDDDALVELYRDALAVIYPPFDEDFGYVTLEAFLAAKPVITCRRLGRPDRVRRRRRERLRVRARGRGDRRGARAPGEPIAGAPRRSAKRGARSRAASPGTGSSRSWWRLIWPRHPRSRS